MHVTQFTFWTIYIFQKWTLYYIPDCQYIEEFNKLARHYITLKVALPVNIVSKSYIFHHFWTILPFLIKVMTEMAHDWQQKNILLV